MPSRRSRPEGLARAAARTAALGIDLCCSGSDGASAGPPCRSSRVVGPAVCASSHHHHAHPLVYYTICPCEPYPAAAAIVAPASTTISRHQAPFPPPAARSAARHAADDEPVGGVTAVRLNDALSLPVLSSPTGQSLPSLAESEAGDSTAARKEESPAARAENPLLQHRPAQPMAPSASRAQISQRSNDPTPPKPKLGTWGPEQRGGPTPIGRRLEACMPGKALHHSPCCPLLLRPLRVLYYCTFASDDDLPCCPDPAAAPSARAGSVLIAFWPRVFVTVMHTMLPLVCLVVLFGEQ